jgi:hypothetical protein
MQRSNPISGNGNHLATQLAHSSIRVSLLRCTS